jgi:hypothetical protein
VLIRKDITVDEVEGLYVSLVEDVLEFEIPNGYKSLRIGLIARLSQFFISAAKQKNSKLNFSWVSENEAERQLDLVNDPVCLTALMISDNVFGTNNSPIKSAMNTLFVDRFNNSVSEYGRQVQMMAVDHSILKYANPECFYSLCEEGATLRDPTYYFELLKGFLNENAKQSDFNIAEYEGLGELLAELVNNTDQHARGGYLRGEELKSVRSVVITCHQITREQNLDDICGKNNPVAAYTASLRPIDRAFNFIEISIFDSGPGIYKSFSGQSIPVTIEEEAEILLRSFQDGVTSKINGVGVGRGLNKARHILNERKGFLAIRTGRLSVYRDYDTLPLDDAGYEGFDTRFLDEMTGSLSKCSEMHGVEGVSYTILVPLR